MALKRPLTTTDIVSIVVIVGGILALIVVAALEPARSPGLQASASAARVTRPKTASDQIRETILEHNASADFSDAQYLGVDLNPEDSDAEKTAVSVKYRMKHAPTFDDDAAEFTATLMQKVFETDYHVDRVFVEFDGPAKNRYGYSKDVPYLGYSMSLETYKKINWNGFHRKQLCKFLTAEGEDNYDATNRLTFENACFHNKAIAVDED